MAHCKENLIRLANIFVVVRNWGWGRRVTTKREVRILGCDGNIPHTKYDIYSTILHNCMYLPKHLILYRTKVSFRSQHVACINTCLWSWHLISKCGFEFWLFHFPSRFLLICLRMTQMLESLPPTGRSRQSSWFLACSLSLSSTLPFKNIKINKIKATT